MGVFCIVLLIIAIVELVIILWLRDAKTKNKDIEKTIDFFRSLWGKFTFYVLATSIIGLFLGSIYFEKVIGLDVINNWVGIVLGLVALIIGIISLFLSFYNVDQAIESQTKSMEIMESVKQEIKDTIANLNNTMQEGFKDLHNELYEYKGARHETSRPSEIGRDDWGEM